jgi:hypothetical protein
LGEIGGFYGYVFSTDINANIYIAERKKKRFALCITPTIKVRMRSNNNNGDRSFAVRTPSYNVKMRAFYALSSSKPSQYQYLEFWSAHHSNGQDGYFLAPDGQVNTRNGSFGTNYGFVGYTAGLSEQLAEKVWSAGLEWHPPFLYHDDALIENYGFTRLHLNGIYKRKRPLEKELFHDNARFLEHWRVQCKLGYSLNHLKGNTFWSWKRRFNGELLFNYLFQPESKAGIYFAVGYYGEDPYNIFFSDKYAFARLGLSAMF